MKNNEINLLGIIEAGQTQVFSSNYEKITNKPQINGVELIGNKSLEDLGVNDLIDEKIGNLINSAPETLDTLGEIAQEIENNQDILEVLNESIGKKVNESDLSKVAKTGNYNDLLDKPELFDGNYESLSNKPIIPTKTSEIVNNGDGTSKFATDSDVNQKIENVQKQITNLENDKASTSYVDTKVANLVNSAPETLDTLGEVATALKQNENVVEALNQAIGNKVNTSDISKVATTGVYDDLLNKPEIPSIVESVVREQNKYDCIIRTQQQFEELCNMLDNNACSYHSILFIGDGSQDGFIRQDKGLKLPQTLRLIDGVNDATITIRDLAYNSATNKAAIFFESAESIFNHEFSINNMTIKCSSSQGQCFCFENVYNINNCTCISNCTYSGAQVGGFKTCNVINNCIVRVLNGGNVNCFHNCRYLTNCFAESIQTSSITRSINRGFATSRFMTNCVASINNSRQSWGFYSCQNLTDCSSTAIGTDVGYGFYQCVRVTNPTIYSSASTTGLYDSSTTYVTITKEDIANKLETSNIIAGDNVLLEVDGNNIKINSYADTPQSPAGSGGSDYDRVIRTQEEFDAFCVELDNSTCTDSSVLFVGDGGTLEFTRTGKNIKIPSTLTTIDGINNVIIRIVDFSGPAFDAVNSSQSEPNHTSRISNIKLVVTTKSGNAYGFRGFYNLYNCSVEVSSTSSSASAVGFVNCFWLYNCTAIGVDGSTQYGFNNCRYVVSCFAQLISQGSFSSTATKGGFNSCRYVTSCISRVMYGGQSYAYRGTNYLTNCLGTASNAKTSGYGFHSCNYVNGCANFSGSNTTELFNSCTYVSLTEKDLGELVTKEEFTGLTQEFGNVILSLEDNIALRLHADNIIAGNNITITRGEGNNVIINSTASGGGTGEGTNVDIRELAYLMGYDLIITNQEEFDAFCTSVNNETCTVSSLLIVGQMDSTPYSYVGTNGLTLPNTLFKIKGIFSPMIYISGLTDDFQGGAIKYNEIEPTMKDAYSIEDIILIAEGGSGASSPNAFNNCYNIRNCIVMCTGGRGAIGFNSCTNIKDTTLMLSLTSTDNNDKWIMGFMGCVNINGITAISDSADVPRLGENYLFGSCSQIGFYTAEGFAENISSNYACTEVMATKETVEELINGAIEGSY